MVQDGTGGGDAVSHIYVAEGTDEYFVDVRDKHFSKGLVVTIVLVEDGGGNLMGVAKVGDRGDQRNRLDSGLSAVVNRSDEGRGRGCCVHGGGDSEL